MSNEDSLIEKIFLPGTGLTIEYVTGKGVVKSYSTTVEDLEYNYVILRAPVVNNEAVIISTGRELNLWCEMEERKLIYVSSVFVVENRPGKIPLLVCSKPKRIQKASQRRFSRFRVDLPLSFTVDKTPGKGRVTEMSFCGCCMEIPAGIPVKKGSLLALSISLPGEPELRLVGEATRCYRVGSGKAVGLAVDYRELSERAHRLLQEFLFQVQLMNH